MPGFVLHAGASVLCAHNGSASLKSGAVGDSQHSSILFRSFFSAGELSFYAKFDSSNCCDRVDVLVDGNQMRSVSGTDQWTQVTIPLPLGVHDIEWRYERDWISGQGATAAQLDDVIFVKQ